MTSGLIEISVSIHWEVRIFIAVRHNNLSQKFLNNLGNLVPELHDMILSCRYIEIFKSSMQELRTASIGSRGGRGMGMGMGRPGPYDRSDRFMGGGGGIGGGMGYGRGRGRGNLKGTYILYI